MALKLTEAAIMTSNEACIRQDKPVAIHSVDEFVFGVPDLEVAERFYSSFGLNVQQEDGALALYTHGHLHRWSRVLQAKQKRLLWLTLGIYQSDLSSFESRLEKLGIPRIAPPPDAKQDGIWISAPDGLALQLQVAKKSSPNFKSPRIYAPENSTAGRAPRRSAVNQVRPNHLSHILLFTADVGASIRFYSEVLGLRLSDRSGEIIAFMHTPHGSDHHLLAFAKSEGSGLHHSSWDVSSFDDVGIGSQQMVKAGYEQGWGLGRHVLGSNYFRYVRDPWGSYAEYSFDIDFIEANTVWPADDYPAEDALYVWGPDVPGDFIMNLEIE